MGKRELPHKERLRALSKLAKSLVTSCAAEDEEDTVLVTMSKLEEIDGLQTVKGFATALAATTSTLGSALSLRQRRAQGLLQPRGRRRVQPADAAALRADCRHRLDGHRFCDPCLNNIAADTAAAAAFSPNENARLLRALRSLLDTPGALPSTARLACSEALERLTGVVVHERAGAREGAARVGKGAQAREGARQPQEEPRQHVRRAVGGGLKLGTLLRSLGQNLTDEELEDMMNEIDADGSGTIEFEEFVMLMKPKGAAESEVRRANSTALPTDYARTSSPCNAL